MTLSVPGIALIIIGMIAMFGAVFNWWIITRSQRLFNRLLGDKAARVIYFVVGALLFLRGIGQLLGKNWI